MTPQQEPDLKSRSEDGEGRRSRTLIVWLRRAFPWVLALTVLAVLAVESVDGLRWRTRLIVLKAEGELPDLSWEELYQFLPPSSGVWLRPVVDSKNPYFSLLNRHTLPGDVQAGHELFLTQCAACHGADARGGSGPDLAQGHFRQGTSDWALFRTIRQGIPGTPMRKRALSPGSVWQVVAFLKQARETAASTGQGVAGVPVAAIEVPNVTFEQLTGAAGDADGWLTYSGAYDGQRHSRLAQISRENIARLGVKWLFQLPTSHRVVEASPLVAGNIMFVSLPPGDVWAIDVRTGERLWDYSGRPAPADIKLSADPASRGLAILGRTVYVATIDAHLVALDAATGRELWTTQVADYRQGFSMTSAPLALRNAIVVGVAGGEFGIRGFVDAYSPIDGKRLWRFYTIPGPGEAGNDTWGNDSWKRGGAPTWLTGSYDPDLDLLYWGVGNPGPDFQGDVRPGDNLYSNSVIALEAQTGRLRWHFQFIPHDEHDRDAVQIPVLADALFGGERRRLIYWANRNGFYYVLDRVTGQFLHGRAFVKQTWAEGLDAKGRPIPIAAARPTRQGTMVYPSTQGATNWWSPSYDPVSNTFFVGAAEGGSIFTNSPELTTPDGFFNGSSATPGGDGILLQAVRALDASTGELRWEHRLAGPTRARIGGLMSTAGGLVFGSEQSRFFALDSRDGRDLWGINTGDTINAAPITYRSGGLQQVTIVAGRTVVTLSVGGQ